MAHGIPRRNGLPVADWSTGSQDRGARAAPQFDVESRARIVVMAKSRAIASGYVSSQSGTKSDESCTSPPYGNSRRRENHRKFPDAPLRFDVGRRTKEPGARAGSTLVARWTFALQHWAPAKRYRWSVQSPKRDRRARRAAPQFPPSMNIPTLRIRSRSRRPATHTRPGLPPPIRRAQDSHGRIDHPKIFLTFRWLMPG
jgi:hypothetical protein